MTDSSQMSASSGDGSAGQSQQSAGAQDWRASLPDEYRGKYEEFKTPADVIKGYDNVLKMANEKIKVPDKPDDVEGWNKVYSRLGRPETHDKYDLGDAKIADALKDDALKQFHSLGLNSQQAQGLLGWYNQLAEAQGAAQKEAALAAQAQEAEASLRKEWGDAYDNTLADLNRFAKENGGEFFAGKPERGNNVELVRFMKTLYDKFGRDGDIKQGGGGASAIASVDAQIKDLRDIQNKVMAHGKEYSDAQNKINELYKQKAKLLSA